MVRPGPTAVREAPTGRRRAAVIRFGIVLLLLEAGCSRADKSEPKSRPADAGVSSGALELGVIVTGTMATFTLTNRSDGPLVVDAAVLAGGARHLDWFQVRIEVGGEVRDLHFTDDRDRSAIERKTLDPGVTTAEAVDLAAWARRECNGGTPLPRGAGNLRATYEVTGDPEAWNGKLEAGPVPVDFP